MKTKKSEKKLKLNKETIATLNGLEMRVVLGGDPCPTETICPSCDSCKATCQLESKVLNTSC
ncbi:MAG: hypothetical protein GTO45_36060 [Candidatus Aminicenantes bacterium]|nr:hypothetical protein [Candidatus Aminicenantes bacterium]NIM84118.1 hypothetical protein [Candidatus Aminicenantes bacterium]NIN23564.1 hypothetical protein [Candidatus Aminicenantes bacterium]NIN47273.1 hypothetical protein [Candidatus Aminicenantes bacterium]NIN90200.1 hypothetical protein [Candidatus Aminicenantes bacterium]